MFGTTLDQNLKRKNLGNIISSVTFILCCQIAAQPQDLLEGVYSRRIQTGEGSSSDSVKHMMIFGLPDVGCVKLWSTESCLVLNCKSREGETVAAG